LQILKDLFQPGEQQIAAVWGEPPYEQVEGGWLEFFVVTVACAHGYLVKIREKAHVLCVLVIQKRVHALYWKPWKFNPF
jgi:hypothetical protein